jgi:hypothetical protein
VIRGPTGSVRNIGSRIVPLSVVSVVS